jgi:hypothetical protein
VCNLHVYTFFGKGDRRYIVNVEQYDDEVYAIKFYCSLHKNRPDKYSILTKSGDAFRIFATCVSIMLSILKENPFATFAIKGMEGESEGGLSKRFKIYRDICQNYFSPKLYAHRQNVRNNLYFLINKDYTSRNIMDSIAYNLKKGFEIEL